MSIASSQRRLLEEGLLDSLGSSGRGESLPNTMKALVNVAEVVITEAQKNLDKDGSSVTGELEESIHAELGDQTSIDIMVLDRYKFINDGVKGTKGGKSLKGYAFKNDHPSKKMVVSILKWIRKRGIRGRLARKYKVISRTERKDVRLTKAVEKSNDLKSLAYAMATSVKQKGIKPTKFLTKAFKKGNEVAKREIANGLRIDVIESLNDN